MTEHEPDRDPPRPDPSEVPSEWAPPASSLPAPPSTAPPVSPSSPLAPPEVAVSTGPVMAEPAARSSWFGRGVALAAAAVLVGGGGYLAINAGSADGGADSPAAALDGVLAALSSEDLIGAAEFVEPSERDTMIDAGFEVVEELVRLELFDDSLDLSSVEGIDLEFDDVEIDSVEVRPGLAHLFITGGRATAAVDGAAAPLGRLITDRVDSEDLAVSESQTQEMTPTSVPIVAVERDGRWYLSLWYSVAENARLEFDAPMPSAADRLAEIGAATPEEAIETFVGALEQIDITTMIGMLDPDEAAALYDYGSLFVDDGQRAADDFLQEVRRDGWFWEVTQLDLRSETDGGFATVYIDRLDVTASDGEVFLDASFTADRIDVGMDSPDVTFDYVVEGDCMTVTYDEGYGPETEHMCTDELLADVGMGSLSSGAMGGLTSIDEAGIVVHNVDGRWYISPLRTGSQMTLRTLRAMDPETVADTVDAFVDLFSDPFAISSAFGGESFIGEESFIEVDDFPGSPTTTYEIIDDYPLLAEENADLLAEGPEYVFVYDLVDLYRNDVWWQWFTDVPEREFGDGVVGQAFLADDSYADIVVLSGLEVESDADLAEWVDGDLVTEAGFTYVAFTNTWGDQLIVARSADGLALVAMYDGFSEEALTVLRNQVGG